MAVDIEQIKRKKKPRGIDLGKLECAMFSRNMADKPGITRQDVDELEKRVPPTEQNANEYVIYQRLYQEMYPARNFAMAIEGQFWDGLNQLRSTLKELEHVKILEDALRSFPVQVTFKEYDELTEYARERRIRKHGDDREPLVSVLKAFTLYENRAPKVLEDALEDLKDDRDVNPVILENWNRDNGVYIEIMKDGTRSDEADDFEDLKNISVIENAKQTPKESAEEREAQAREIERWGQDKIKEINYKIAGEDTIKDKAAHIRKLAREIMPRKKIKATDEVLLEEWKYFAENGLTGSDALRDLPKLLGAYYEDVSFITDDKPPEGVTKWDVVHSEQSLKRYESGELSGQFKADFFDLVSALETITNVDDGGLTDWELRLAYMEKESEDMTLQNFPESSKRINRAVQNGIVILPKPEPGQIGEDGKIRERMIQTVHDNFITLDDIASDEWLQERLEKNWEDARQGLEFLNDWNAQTIILEKAMDIEDLHENAALDMTEIEEAAEEYNQQLIRYYEYVSGISANRKGAEILPKVMKLIDYKKERYTDEMIKKEVRALKGIMRSNPEKMYSIMGNLDRIARDARGREGGL